MMISVIRPKDISITAQRRAIDNSLLTAVEDAKVLFKFTYHNWEPENKPNFDVIGPRTKNGHRELIYQTKDEPYVLVANGTDGPYSITPKNSQGFLRFKAGGTPKTKPGRFQSMVSTPGTDWVTAKAVTHPGIEAREPQKEVAMRVQPTVVAAMQHELGNALGK